MSNEFRPRCLIIGHSFIWRLANYASAPGPVKEKDYKFTKEVIRRGIIDFNLKQCEVKYFSLPQWWGLQSFGVSRNLGKSKCNAFTELQRECSEYQPHIIFLQIGENDIAIDRSEHKIVSDILSLASFLVQGLGVLEVCIGEQLTRPIPRFLSPQDYFSRRQFVNRLLKEGSESGQYLKLTNFSQFSRGIP